MSTTVDAAVVPVKLPEEGRVSVPAGALATLLAWAEKTNMPVDVLTATADVQAGVRALSKTAGVERLRELIADALCGGGNELVTVHATHEDQAEQVYAALDDAGVILTPARRAEIRALVVREAARLADRVTNERSGTCTCPPGSQRECGWRDGAGTVAQRLWGRLEQESAVTAADVRAWSVPAEPGPDVTAVRDVATGGVYTRLRAGGWVREAEDGEALAAPVTWAWLIRAATAGLVDVTDEAE